MTEEPDLESTIRRLMIVSKEREEAAFRRAQIEMLEAEAKHGDTEQSRREARIRLMNLKYGSYPSPQQRAKGINHD